MGEGIRGEGNDGADERSKREDSRVTDSLTVSEERMLAFTRQRVSRSNRVVNDDGRVFPGV